MRREQTEKQRPVRDVSAGHPRTRQAGGREDQAGGREDQDVSLASRLPAPCPAPAHLCCEVDIVDELRVGQARGPARVTQQAGGGTSETPGSPGFCPFRHTCGVLVGPRAGLSWALLFKESCHAPLRQLPPTPQQDPGQLHPPSPAPMTLPFLPQPSRAFLAPTAFGEMPGVPEKPAERSKELHRMAGLGEMGSPPPPGA